MATDGEPYEAWLSVAFIDAVGSAALTNAHGDQAAIRLAVTLDAMTAELDDRGVRTIKHLGDGLLAVAAAPAALVTGVQHVMGFDRADPSSLRLRAGIAHGSVMVRKGDVLGVVVNLAARLCDLARPGSILMAEDVHFALPLAVGAQRREPVTIRGFSKRVSVAELACASVPGGWVEDPVCQMLIDPTLAVAHVVDAAGMHWFCSEACRSMHEAGVA